MKTDIENYINKHLARSCWPGTSRMSLTSELKNVVDSWRVCVCEQDANGAALALGGELTFSPLHPPSTSSISGI